MITITCVRCRRERPAVAEVPYAGELGAEIREKTCIDCWAEWQQAEVMIINELRLDFMNAKSLDILTQHLREFLGLDSASPTDP